MPLAAQITPICMIAYLPELDRTPVQNGGYLRVGVDQC
jgi:hypothetical protein